LGLDMAAWIEEELVDYVAPGDFGFTDFNERYEEFVSLARAHECCLYPRVQPTLAYRPDKRILMKPANYRAAVRFMCHGT